MSTEYAVIDAFAEKLLEQGDYRRNLRAKNKEIEREIVFLSEVLSSQYQPQETQSSRHQPKGAQSSQYQPQEAQSSQFQPQETQSSRHQPQGAQSSQYQPQEAQSSQFQPQQPRPSQNMPQQFQPQEPRNFPNVPQQPQPEQPQPQQPRPSQNMPQQFQPQEPRNLPKMPQQPQPQDPRPSQKIPQEPQFSPFQPQDPRPSQKIPQEPQFSPFKSHEPRPSQNTPQDPQSSQIPQQEYFQYSSQDPGQVPAPRPSSQQTDLYGVSEYNQSVRNESFVSGVISESDVSVKSDTTNAEVCPKKSSSKWRHNVEKLKLLLPPRLSSRSRSKKLSKNYYQFIKETTPDIYCSLWSSSHGTPIFPPKKTLNETKKEFVTPRGCREREWKSPIIFDWDGNSHSEAIVCDNIKIPYSPEKGYGKSFLYLRLPKALEKVLKKASKEYPFLDTKDGNLCRKGRYWWKVTGDVDGLIGIVDEVGNFQPKPLEKIFEKTQKGITASLVLKFHCEATVEGRKSLRRKHVRKIGVEVVKGNIESIGRNIPLPIGPKNLQRIATFVRSDEVESQLRELNI